MGVLPLEFLPGTTRATLHLDGSELWNIKGVAAMKPRAELNCEIKRSNGKVDPVILRSRIDTTDEFEYFRNGGIMQYVMRKLL